MLAENLKPLAFIFGEREMLVVLGIQVVGQLAGVAVLEGAASLVADEKVGLTVSQEPVVVEGSHVRVRANAPVALEQLAQPLLLLLYLVGGCAVLELFIVRAGSTLRMFAYLVARPHDLAAAILALLVVQVLLSVVLQ